MRSHDHVLADHQQQIASLEATFSGHRGVDRPSLLYWLRQFRPEHIPLAVRVLESVRYYTRGNVSALCKATVDLAARHLDTVPRNQILFTVAGRIWEGNSVVARALRYSHAVPTSQVLELTDLREVKRGEWDAVVFLKDFAGTGTQLTEWWVTTGEALALPLEAEVIIGVLVLNQQAREAIEALELTVLSTEELGYADNVFHEASAGFSAEERETILEYCEGTGVSQQFVRGYGGNALLVAFDHGCPNNSLPILWRNSDTWTGLFGRHSL